MSFKCEKCNKEFSTKRGLSSHLKIHSNIKYITKKCIKYNENPKLCKECNNIIPYSSYTNLNSIQFCSKSCIAYYNTLAEAKQMKQDLEKLHDWEEVL